VVYQEIDFLLIPTISFLSLSSSFECSFYGAFFLKPIQHIQLCCMKNLKIHSHVDVAIKKEQEYYLQKGVCIQSIV
jgi:hypothetical protein